MHRSAKRLAGLLTCAAVPVLLVAGCSGSDGKSSGGSTPSGSSSAAGAPSPTVAAAKYKKLPNACEAFSKDTVNTMLPKVKDAAGSPGKTSDPATRGSCTWSSSDEQGVDGTQFRWLDVAYQRYDSDPALGSGEKRATDFFTQQVNDAKGTPGAKKTAVVETAGTGDTATSITYDIKKDGNDFKNTTVVARAANIVVTVDYNGAGLAGADTPNGNDLLKAAQAAAKEAVATAAKANGAPPAKS
ncbi:hypothetical protein ADL22_32540 [Streptomyces sp. NRRL F-4489]|uniref:DUF3558 domain-containing protein n=1 Tax=Streptomyces sp. NRRL F-4489 TaxID=1609095 RepID=UPI000749BB56|nr:DUF3558 domain-containing protein [Streptomyces sp. NRRL F-4489]KUL33636.1 hypothetical protein ADL22_32540 [Streptomyces sp. NRRL F-4489]